MNAPRRGRSGGRSDGSGSRDIGKARATRDARPAGGRQGPAGARQGAQAERPARQPAIGRQGASGRGGSDDAGRRQSGPRGLGGDQIEGRQAVRELLIAGRRRVKEVLISHELEPAPILDDIFELAEVRRVPVRSIGRSKFDALTSTQASQGVMARAQQLPEFALEELAKRRKPSPAFLIMLDGVTDPQNLGAVLRAGECAGVTGVILPRHRAVHVTPTVTKAAAGAIEYVPMTLVGGLPTALTQLADLDLLTVGLDADAPTSIYDLALGDRPIVLVLGAEGKGLSRLVKERCEVLASVPMMGNLNSLNVASAGSIACFEVARQRAQHAAAQAARAAARAQARDDALAPDEGVDPSLPL